MKKHINIILPILIVAFICTSCFTKKIEKPRDVKEKMITVEGIAQNGKGGALVVTDDNKTYYLDGVDQWDDSVVNKKVSVEGILITTTTKPEDLKNEKGEWTQGSVGEKNSILNPKWKVIN